MPTTRCKMVRRSRSSSRAARHRVVPAVAPPRPAGHAGARRAALRRPRLDARAHLAHARDDGLGPGDDVDRAAAPTRSTPRPPPRTRTGSSRTPAATPLYLGTSLAADFGNPAYRAWWIAQVTARPPARRASTSTTSSMERRVYYVGGYRASARDPRTGATMTEANWQRYMADFMVELRAALPDRRDRPRRRSGTRATRAPTSSASSPPPTRGRDREARRPPRPPGPTAGRRSRGSSSAARPPAAASSSTATPTRPPPACTGSATALLLDTGALALGNDAWTAPSRYWTGYDVRPRRAGRRPRCQWSGVWRRDFASGIVLVNPPGNGARARSRSARLRRPRRRRRRPADAGAGTAVVLRKVRRRADPDSDAGRRPRSPRSRRRRPSPPAAAAAAAQAGQALRQAQRAHRGRRRRRRTPRTTVVARARAGHRPRHRRRQRLRARDRAAQARRRVGRPCAAPRTRSPSAGTSRATSRRSPAAPTAWSRPSRARAPPAPPAPSYKSRVRSRIRAAMARIALVCEPPDGGAAEHVAQLARGLRAHGHEAVLRA